MKICGYRLKAIAIMSILRNVLIANNLQPIAMFHSALKFPYGLLAPDPSIPDPSFTATHTMW